MCMSSSYWNGNAYVFVVLGSDYYPGQMSAASVKHAEGVVRLSNFSKRIIFS